MIVDSIYLNKRGSENDTRKWVYYRVSSHGADRDHIELCRINFPDLRDVSAALYSPKTTGTQYAERDVNQLVRRWKFKHQRSILIGFRARKITGSR